MAWIIEYSARALRSLRKIDKTTQQRIVDFMDNRVAVHQQPLSLAKPMQGKFSGKWRYRVGDYRLICSLEDQKMVILVIEIGHRSDIYE
ncbi:MAG: type II toxin-antitoxin system RelE/ParE family toxin [Pseudomonadota bacterium]